MSKLIAIIGNCGSGKTTLAGLLCAQPGYQALLEQHEERPFQRLAMESKAWAFHNQVDYLLYRAEQELAARRLEATSVADGGLDQDFYIFTRLFYEKGLYTPPEFEVCARLYRALRQALRPPDAIIRLVVPLEMLVERRARRKRALDIATDADLPRIEQLLGEFEEAMVPQAPLLRLDGRAELARGSPGWQEMMTFIEQAT